MIPKSLVIFVSFGVVAGFAFGLYLIDLKNTNELVFVEGPSLTILTDKADYKRGEEIHIRIVNSGSETLSFLDSSYGLKITGLSGMLMFSPPVKLESKDSKQIELEPTQEISFVWDQMKNNGEPAIEGVYKVTSKTLETSIGKHIEKSITITIWK